MSNRMFFGTLGAISLLFCAGVFGFQNGWFQSADPPEIAQKTGDVKLQQPSLKPTKEKIERDGLVLVGGVYRKRSDVEIRTASQEKDLTEEGRKLTARIGRFPAIAAESNAYTRSVAEALANPEKFPERLSALVSPKPFDKESFEKDPKTYLYAIEPGRVFQDLRAGKNVPALLRTSPGFQKVIQGETVQLMAKGLPGTPISFHTPVLGGFSNGLKTITVRADTDGKVLVNFTAAKGTFGLVKVVAASPEMSNRPHYYLGFADICEF